MKKTILTIVFGLPMLGASCLSLGEKISEQATEKVLEGVTRSEAVNIDGDGISVEGMNGEKIEIGTKKLPDDFPKNIGIFPGAEPVSAFSTGKTDGQRGWTITLSTPESVSKVQEFYVTALADQGWKTTYSYTLDESYGYVIETDELSGTLTLSQGDDGKTSIFMSLSENESN